MNRSKNSFFNKLNSDIETGKVLNWKQFKKLKKHKEPTDKFDSYDMKNFQDFFTKLYENVHGTITSEKKQELLQEAESINTLIILGTIYSK